MQKDEYTELDALAYELYYNNISTTPRESKYYGKESFKEIHVNYGHLTTRYYSDAIRTIRGRKIDKIINRI